MANFDRAWVFTSENEGADSSYEQYTKWGITKGYLAFWKIGKPTDAYIQTMTAVKAGEIVKQTIWNKVIQGHLIEDQHLANMLLDLGFNKPKYVIQWVCQLYGLDPAAAVDRFQIPRSVINSMNRESRCAYDEIWKKWWNWAISSGHFKKGSVVGMSRRIWRYKIYGKIGTKDLLDGVSAARRDTLNSDMRYDLHAYLAKRAKKAIRGIEDTGTQTLASSKQCFIERPPEPADNPFSIVPTLIGGVLLVGTSVGLYFWAKKST